MARGPPVPPMADDDDSSTTYTGAAAAAATPPASDATGLHDNDRDHNDGSPLTITEPPPPVSSTPQPGRTYLIQAIPSGQVITLRGGRIILCEPDSRASHWDCVETNDGGWLGFRNGVSAAYLGRDNCLRLCCAAGWHQGWERFRVREKKHEGGVMGGVLLMDHWWSLRHVGVKVENGAGRLAVVENWEADEVVWGFVEV